MKHLNQVFKDPISGLTHLGTAVLAALGTVLIIWLSPAGLARLAMAIYGISLVLLFSASATYHLVHTSPQREEWLRKIDHIAIFLLIAGTYTPVCLVVLTGAWRWGLLIPVWCIAAAGTVFKLVWVRSPRWMTASIYVVMGWLGVIGVAQIIQALSWGAILWLALGGLLYTGGSVIYATKKPDFFPGVFGFHEIWHLFVTAGGAAHFVFVAAYILPLALKISG
jgi:hemolysin III